MPESVGADASDMGARSAGNAARSGPGVHGGPPRGRHGSIARQDASCVLGRPAANALRQVPTKNLQPRPERALAPRMGLELPGQLSFEIWLRIGAQPAVAVVPPAGHPKLRPSRRSCRPARTRARLLAPQGSQPELVTKPPAA